MGLAGEKRKQRLVGSAITRNSAWLTDTSLPGQRLLSQMGWSEGQGIGGSGAGRTETIKTMYKMDNKGIGSQRAEKEMRSSGQSGVGGADKWIGGAGELGGLFERLNAVAGETSLSGASTPVIEAISERKSVEEEVGESKDKKRKRNSKGTELAGSSAKDPDDQPQEKRSKGKSRAKEGSDGQRKERDAEKKSNRSKRDKPEAAEEVAAVEAVAVETVVRTIRNASRAKYLRAKRQLYGDAISMNEILGIASGSNSPAPAPASPQAISPRIAPASAPPVPDSIFPVISLGEDESDKERKRREKKERKASKTHAKEAKRTQAARLSTEGIVRPAAEVPAEKKELILNTVSSLSVHEYLSRKLMLRKAQMARRRKTDQDAVWGRLSAGSGVGIIVD